MGGSRTYHDPLHGGITLHRDDPTEALLIQLIDSPEFQRLRRIRQLGPASLTFHGAEASRFTHSLGVMQVARRAFDALARSYGELLPHRTTVLCAAMLHDLGHGPFSHTCEDIFDSHHEDWTARILLESPPINRLLRAADADLPEMIIATYRKHHALPLVSQLISSQLDCDRLDYLMRDSYYTGTSYGNLDLDRILAALRYDPKRRELVVAAKGQAAIEHYLIVRSLMYAQVYNHPKNIAAAWGLNQAFRRARELYLAGQLQTDSTLAAWLGQAPLGIEDYLAADDPVFNYHLQSWQRQGAGQPHQDPLLADLSQRCVNRRLFKAKALGDLSADQQQDLLAQVQTVLAERGLSPTHYAGLEVAFSRGYQPYREGIRVQTPSGSREIGEVSPLIRALVQTRQTTWLIYPRLIEGELQVLMED
ncbi:MAG: HD domain-containing protein [Synechococcales cyanobacterium RM1_1_8]|nr:HD domain-containing protein [Synechococcales cyanobacterium RM1_1_8]